MSTWIALALAGIGSYLFRYGPLVALERVTVPPVVERALRHAGPSTMAALAASSVAHQPPAGAGGMVAVAVALAAATAAALLQRSFLVAVAAGLAVFGVLDLVI